MPQIFMQPTNVLRSNPVQIKNQRIEALIPTHLPIECETAVQIQGQRFVKSKQNAGCDDNGEAKARTQMLYRTNTRTNIVCLR